MSYLDNALKIAGLPTNGNRQEKIDRLVKNGAKNNNAPKPTISKAAGKNKVSAAKKSDVKDTDAKLNFFRENVSKLSGTMSEKRKKLEAMWLAVDNPTPPQDKYSIFDEELEIDFAISMGLKKVGEKDGKHVYKAIDAPTSSSKTDNPSPVSSLKAASSKASPKAKESPKKNDNEDAEDDAAESSFGIFKCWLGSLSKPTLVAIAQDKKISVGGNKPDLVDKLMTSTGVNEADDSDSDSDSDSNPSSDDSDGDGDGDEDDEDEEDEEDEE